MKILQAGLLPSTPTSRTRAPHLTRTTTFQNPHAPAPQQQYVFNFLICPYHSEIKFIKISLVTEYVFREQKYQKRS